MSTDSSAGINDPTFAPQIRDVRSTYKKQGHPPSSREVANRSTYTRGYYEHTPGTWEDLLEAADVPTPAEIVVADLRDRLANRPAWQDFIVLQASDLTEATGLSNTRVGQTFHRLVDDDRTLECPDDLEISKLTRSWEIRVANDCVQEDV